MNVLKRSGASAALARALAPVLRRLFPDASRDPAALEALTGNVSANLLGARERGDAARHRGGEADGARIGDGLGGAVPAGSY